ncbi:hypothetical protein EWM64_g6003 [Hericium alpestre]|uniref:Tyrosine specific protein phosphatases domain-containing protein n=1 Tax=Hericium alpestre TaxID=135208 RepID=A0A4Y9ZWX3_9AGAM|nr:hypothetical protein EWM64_g6003 [Hericium alpestre]
MDTEDLDPKYVAQIISGPPFVTIPGVHNVRDLGSYRTAIPGQVTRPGYMFRSGEISSITDEGESQRYAIMAFSTSMQLITAEMLKYSTPIPSISGVNIVHAPIFKMKDYSPQMMARRFELYASGKIQAFMQLYSEILDAAGPAFGTIFRHVRDKPKENFLFHCTAGKDRTGILAAILLLVRPVFLANVDDETIAKDYALTRIGREPMRKAIMERLQKEPVFINNPDAALNMLSSRHETMLEFLKMFREQYGGAEAYVKRYCELSNDDIATIRRHITSPYPPDPS